MDDMFDDLDNLLQETNKEILCELNIEASTEKLVEEEEHSLIPLDYRIFTTHNGLVNGKKEMIDVYNCDRVKGIIPIGKARKKADLMKQAFKNKTFFVEETSSKVYVSGKKVVTVSKVIYQTL